MAFSTLTLAFIAGLIAWITRKILDSIGRRGRPYPPGPKPKPLIANMFDFPTADSAKVYMEWERKYNSPLLHAEALGSHILVINSLDDANALFERPDRAKIYSDRPQMPILNLMGWADINLSLMPYGEQWRQHRKICHQNFNVQAGRQYELIQLKKVRTLLQNLLDTPERFQDHNKLFSVSISIATMYGQDVETIEDPRVKLADDALQLGSTLMVPGGSIINVIPAIRHIPEWFPGFSSKGTAAKVRHMTHEVLKITLDRVKESFNAGSVPRSLVTDFYDRKYTSDASQEEETIVKNVAYTVYGGASDTTTSIASSFMYLMATNPEIQRKAHAEIDNVIGSQRLPEFADRRSLPYIEAIYREVLRIWPPLPVGMPHAISEDDYYNGYFVPKGTTVLANIWAMTHNEETYPDPYAFKPERHLDSHGNLMDGKVLAYGFGRRRVYVASTPLSVYSNASVLPCRACVGKPVASSTVWIMMVSVLAAFNITKSKDKDENEIEIDDDFENDGLLLHKKHFLCSFHPRSPQSIETWSENH